MGTSTGGWVLSVSLAAFVAIAGCSSDETSSPNTTANAGASGGGGTAGAGGSAGASGSSGAAGAAAQGGASGSGGSGAVGGSGGGNASSCDQVNLLARPEDPAARGPWAVGASTVEIDGLTVEVWYPAEAASEQGQAPVRYDIRKALPASEQSKISDDKNPWQDCDCYRDLPLDSNHGPYPAVLFLHGTAAFRTQSLRIMTHWASRGFIVLAADHPGLWLADMLGIACPGGMQASQDIAGNVASILGALSSSSTAGPLQFLAGRVDLQRMALVGHSAGGNSAATLADQPGILASIPLAASASVNAGPDLLASLYMAGDADGVVDYSKSKDAYNASPGLRRFVGLKNAGHLAFSDLCDARNSDGQNMLEIAEQAGVCGANLAGFLFDCSIDLLPGEKSIPIVNAATTALLEEVLQCTPHPSTWETLATTYSDVAEVNVVKP